MELQQKRVDSKRLRSKDLSIFLKFGFKNYEKRCFDFKFVKRESNGFEILYWVRARRFLVSSSLSAGKKCFKPVLLLNY